MAEEGSKRVHGAGIKAIREALGLGQAAVAAEAGISVPYLSQIENNVRLSVGEDTFAGLTRALRVRDKRALMATPCTNCVAKQEVA